MTLSFRSARLTARVAETTDEPDIRAVFSANAPLLKLLDREHDPEVLAARFVHRQNLPPQGHPSRLHNLILEACESGRAVGLLSVYEGYPTRRIAYIGQLFLHPDVHGQGLGREIYLQLESLLRRCPLQVVRVGVALRNWNALRFWTRLGFLRITGMSGDRHFAPEAHAFLELQKNL
jgi:ribosomal protein S18 acetylase RimI-like enzyme